MQLVPLECAAGHCTLGAIFDTTAYYPALPCGIHAADVRFYTLATVRAVAVKYSSGAAVPRAGGAMEGEDQQEAADVEALAAVAAEVAAGG